MSRRELRTKAAAGAVSLLVGLSLVTGCTDNGVGGGLYGDGAESEENGEENGDD